MKLKKINRLGEVKEPPKSKKTTEVKAEVKKPKNKLPSDEYRDEFPPVELELDEHKKIVFSVKRGGEFGLPMCDMRVYVTTDEYTGFTKKGINFPIEYLADIVECLNEITEKCDNKHLFE